MPNRVVKESTLDSPTLARVSELAELHFRKILNIIDDHGCLEVSPAVLRGRAYARRPAVTEADVDLRTRELVEVGVVRIWSDGDRVYGFLPNFDRHSGACFTGAGAKTRHRRRTPTPPDWVRFPKTSDFKANNTSIYNGGELRQAEPDGASESQAAPLPDPDPGITTSFSSTNVGVANYSPRDSSADRSPEVKPQGRTLRRHTNPPAEIDRLVDYQTEVLNKLDGITTVTERADRGTLLLIARHVPPSIVHAALEATQDARLRALDGEHKRVSHARYFTDGVKRRCMSAGIQSPFTHDAPREKHVQVAASP